MDNLIEKLNSDYQQAWKWKLRRTSEWNENYTLYRDRGIIDRLLQRHSVNIPLMKGTIRTWLAQIDDAPDVVFEAQEEENKDQSIEIATQGEPTAKDKEIFLNEYWLKNSEDNKLVLKDIVDKKQVGLYGRSFKKLNVVDGKPYVEIIDPQDILIDRYTDPVDLDTAQFLIHIHIYRTLSEIESNPDYDKKAIKNLKDFYTSKQGLVKAEENRQSAQQQAQKMERMGVPDVANPMLGETYVEINEHYKKVWDKDNWKLHLMVKANNEILMDKPLEEVIGETKDRYWRDHYPFSSWTDDLERTDFWSDSIADIVRVPNKVLNVWFSQMIENRTLRSFGMNFYDASNENFVPQTFQPTPWGWYPVPGKPQDVFQKVDIPDLSNTIEEMTFLINLSEKATAITALQKGQAEPRQITLGEVKILEQKSQERIMTTAKFYRESWKDFAYKWLKLVEAQKDNLIAVKLYKKSVNGDVFEKEVSPTDWQTEAGYSVKVSSSTEQEKDQMNTIQRLNAVIAQIPNNQPLQKIYKRKLLELANLNPEEVKEVMDFENTTPTNEQPAGGQPMPVNDQPTNEQLTSEQPAQL